MPGETKKYHVKFNFTRDTKNDILPGVVTDHIGKRLIRAEFGLDPSIENPGDLRYETDDGNIAMELMKLIFTISDGGWFSVLPMPEGISVFHIPPIERERT